MNKQYEEEAAINGQQIFKATKNALRMSVSHRSIGLITFQHPSGRMGTASGVMISKNLIFTVAHAIFDHNYRKQSKKFRFYLAPHGKLQNNFFQINDYRYPQEYETVLSDNLSFYDYALMSIKTSSNCVTHKSFPELYVTCTEAECVPLDPLKLPLDIFGYPINKAELIEGINNDLDNQSNLKFFQCGFSKEQTIHIQKNQKKFFYKISTAKGMSGCPVFCYGAIFGIHLGSRMEMKILEDQSHLK